MLPAVRAPGTVVLLADMRVPCLLVGGFQDTGCLKQDRGLLSQFEWELLCLDLATILSGEAWIGI